MHRLSRYAFINKKSSFDAGEFLSALNVLTIVGFLF